MLGVKRRILLVGSEGIVLYNIRTRSGVRREGALAWEVPDFERRLTELLLQGKKSYPVRIVFDGADQTYRKEENIPKLSPFDRPRFVKRKLELAFPSYPIRASLEIDPRKNKRGRRSGAAPSYLFVALPETDHLDSVSRAILEAGVPIAGFGLLPLESAGLASELSTELFGEGKASRWVTLVSQHETGGLRQVVIKDGNLALTRLTPPAEGGVNGAGWAEDVLRELRATLTYISRFGYSSNDGLDVIVIGGDVEAQFFNTQDMPITNFRCINLSAALQVVGGKIPVQEKTNFADALHAAWIGRKNSLMLPVSVPSIRDIMAPRLAARVAMAGMVAAAVAFAAYTFNGYQDYLSMEEEAASKQIQREGMQREYDQEAKVFDTLPMKPDVVARALSIKETLNKNTVNPDIMLNRLRRTLGPDIVLEQLRFQHTPDEALSAEGRLGKPIVYGADGKPLDRGSVQMTFRFTLSADIPLEQKVQRAEALQKSLTDAFPGYNVTIVSQFGKVSPSGSFTGGTGSGSTPPADGANDYAEFQMQGAPL